MKDIHYRLRKKTSWLNEPNGKLLKSFNQENVNICTVFLKMLDKVWGKS